MASKACLFERPFGAYHHNHRGYPDRDLDGQEADLLAAARLVLLWAALPLLPCFHPVDERTGRSDRAPGDRLLGGGATRGDPVHAGWH